MLNLSQSSKFKKDYKLCIKRGYDLNLLQAAVNTLRIPAPLQPKNKDHPLSGNHVGERECHITPDWLLIYRINDKEPESVNPASHFQIQS